MAMEITNNYNSVYEGTYTAQKQQAAKKEEAKGTSEVKAKTTNNSSNEEYIKTLQKQVPYIKLQTGYGINTNNDGKVNVVDVNPKLLEKMQNDPKAAKEYTQRLKDVESCAKFFNNFFDSKGFTVVCRHDYLDENGNYTNFTITVRKDELNEKLRKEAQENAEKQIEKIRMKARERAEELEMKLAEKREEKMEKEQEEKAGEESKGENEAENEQAFALLSGKMENAENGILYMDEKDMAQIIEATKKEGNGQSAVYEAGMNVDVKL